MAGAAEDGDEHELAGLGPVGELRRRDLLRHPNEHAADAAQRRRYDVADQQHTPRGNAEIFQPRLVGLDRAQHVPARTVEVALGDDGGGNRDGERQAQQHKLERLRRERHAGNARAWNADAVRAVGVVEHLLQQRPQHHGEGEVEHAEEDLAVAHHEQADQQAQQRRHDGAHQQIADEVADTEIAAPEAGGVGAGGKEHRVPERDLPRLQQDDDAEHHDALGQDQRDERGHAGDQERHADREHHDRRQRPIDCALSGPSDLPDLGCAEQPLGPHQQHDHHDQIRHQHLELGIGVDDEGARQPDRQRGDRRALDLSQPRGRRHRKRQHDHFRAHARHQRRRGRRQRAAKGGQGCANDEGDEIDPLRVDADGGGRFAVLGDGQDHRARQRAPQKIAQPEQRQHGHGGQQQRLVGRCS